MCRRETVLVLTVVKEIGRFLCALQLKVTLEKLAQTAPIRVRPSSVLFASVSLTVLSELFIEAY